VGHVSPGTGSALAGSGLSAASAGLFAELGYGQVWAKMIADLEGLTGATPVASLRALFDLLRGPAAGSATKGVYWRGRLVTAIDGTMMCPDTSTNLRKFPPRRGHHDGTGYPMIRMRCTAPISRMDRTMLVTQRVFPS
jgi:hypothetical protein